MKVFFTILNYFNWKTNETKKKNNKTKFKGKIGRKNKQQKYFLSP
jgi:hypothetical protein